MLVQNTQPKDIEVPYTNKNRVPTGAGENFDEKSVVIYDGRERRKQQEMKLPRRRESRWAPIGKRTTWALSASKEMNGSHKVSHPLSQPPSALK